MRIIPVLDVLGGVVVHGVGGRRSEYRPIVSQFTSSTEPVEVARALVDAFHPRELYLADLDAIEGAEPAYEIYRTIRGLGISLWVDAGVRDAGGAMRLADDGYQVVAGLETVADAQVLWSIIQAVGPARVVFSLDLREGKPLREWPTASGRPPQFWSPASIAVGFGIDRVIVLDLARVGGGTGTGTEELCREIADAFPKVEVITGGGVSNPDDLKRLEACGVKGVLVASALHDGRIKP